jgi:hypothetical protein
MSDTSEKPRREPSWIGRLSRMGATAERMQGKSRGTFGAASTGKQLFAWSCACGWEGTSRELDCALEEPGRKAGQIGFTEWVATLEAANNAGPRH